jgi:hypothetical protein
MHIFHEKNNDFKLNIGYIIKLYVYIFFGKRITDLPLLLTMYINNKRFYKIVNYSDKFEIIL